MTTSLAPGATIGILGGGQLGRMLSVAASRLGFLTHVYEPGADPPAGQVAHRVTTAPYDDAAALSAFAGSVDVVTYEFENIPTAVLDLLEALCPIRPGRAALATSQDRLTEKTFLQGLGLQTAPFAAVDDAASLADALDAIGTPSILKTRRFGYDGKGQVRLAQGTDPAAALAGLNGAPAILEGFVNFGAEISVIAARGLNGEVAAYDPGENVHRDGILHITQAPANASDDVVAKAQEIAGSIAQGLGHVGTLCVELFDVGGELLVNEVAPRVHNSGHHTYGACVTNQFENHARAVLGLPLGDTTQLAPAAMLNVLGDSWHDGEPDWAPVLSTPGATLHLYGKREARPGRKMGHVTVVGEGAVAACERLHEALRPQA